LNLLRRERLREYEDQLRMAKNTKDFSKVLDEYQLAQGKVDKEMDKQRQQ